VERAATLEKPNTNRDCECRVEDFIYSFATLMPQLRVATAIDFYVFKPSNSRDFLTQDVNAVVPRPLPCAEELFCRHIKSEAMGEIMSKPTC
jgi:hypothetical protein